jgi:hypothetical protein
LAGLVYLWIDPEVVGPLPMFTLGDALSFVPSDSALHPVGYGPSPQWRSGYPDRAITIGTHPKRIPWNTGPSEGRSRELWTCSSLDSDSVGRTHRTGTAADARAAAGHGFRNDTIFPSSGFVTESMR